MICMKKIDRDHGREESTGAGNCDGEEEEVEAGGAGGAGGGEW